MRSFPSGLLIDCGTCVARQTAHCDDCMVSYLCEREDDRVVVSADELASLRVLQEAGMVPRLRHIPLLTVPA